MSLPIPLPFPLPFPLPIPLPPPMPIWRERRVLILLLLHLPVCSTRHKRSRPQTPTHSCSTCCSTCCCFVLESAWRRPPLLAAHLTAALTAALSPIVVVARSGCRPAAVAGPCNSWEDTRHASTQPVASGSIYSGSTATLMWIHCYLTGSTATLMWIHCLSASKVRTWTSSR
jgi:hypothetical protein